MARRALLAWVWRVSGALVACGVTIVLLGATLLYHRMGSSLPLLQGTVVAVSAPGPVEILRDAAGMPDIAASDRAGAAYGLGFIHAQERFFQMDIARHLAAGRLGELFGPAIVPIDRRFRLHRLQAVAIEAVKRLPAMHARVLDAYVAGVNAGLRTLARRPFEYVLLGVKPAAWTSADSFLALLGMYLLLQDSEGDQDYNTEALYRTLPPDLAAFLSPAGAVDWDAPMLGKPEADPALPSTAHFAVPGAAAHANDDARDWRYRGSNAWAVAGWRRGGRPALVANDMHLLFGLPNIFFRARMHGAGFSLCGLTLPGLPALIAGSNGHLVWGFTNTAGEWSDLIRLRDGHAPGTYATADGDRPYGHVDETLHAKGAADTHLVIEETMWGPVLRRGPDRTGYAVQWVAHSPLAANLGLLDLEAARSVREAMQIAPKIGMPEENLVAGDEHGDIGWTVTGPIPLRGARPRPVPQLSTDAHAGWQGWLDARAYPKLENPPEGLIWTANNRIGDGETALAMGNGYTILGARAKQIRDSLRSAKSYGVDAMLELQRDDRAIFLARWQELLVHVLAKEAPSDARLGEALQVAQIWGGRADTNSAGYRLVREFRHVVDEFAFAPFLERVRQSVPDFSLDRVGNQREAALWRLVQTRPAALLNARFASWDSLLLQAARDAVRGIAGSDRAIALARWGDANRLSMRHPMSPFIPFLGLFTDMAAVPLAGDENMPLSQQSGQGPVMRLVALAGEEDRSVLELAGGNAGNPRSPYYGAGQKGWLKGAPVALLPGPPRYRLLLAPPGAMQGGKLSNAQ